MEIGKRLESLDAGRLHHRLLALPLRALPQEDRPPRLAVIRAVLRSALNFVEGVVLLLLGVPILFAALRWTILKLQIFACANRSVSVRIGLELIK